MGGAGTGNEEGTKEGTRRWDRTYIKLNERLLRVGQAAAIITVVVELSVHDLTS